MLVLWMPQCGNGVCHKASMEVVCHETIITSCHPSGFTPPRVANLIATIARDVQHRGSNERSSVSRAEPRLWGVPSLGPTGRSEPSLRVQPVQLLGLFCQYGWTDVVLKWLAMLQDNTRAHLRQDLAQHALKAMPCKSG